MLGFQCFFLLLKQAGWISLQVQAKIIQAKRLPTYGLIKYLYMFLQNSLLEWYYRQLIHYSKHITDGAVRYYTVGDSRILLATLPLLFPEIVAHFPHVHLLTG